MKKKRVKNNFTKYPVIHKRVMRHLILFLFLIFLSDSFSGIYAQNKELIYTLSDHEFLDIDKSKTNVYHSGVGYILTIEGENERKYFVNGKLLEETFTKRRTEEPIITPTHWGIIDKKEKTDVVLFDQGYKKEFDTTAFVMDLKIANELLTYVIYDKTHAQFYVVINGNKQGPFLNLNDYYLSPDGENWAISYHENNGLGYDYYFKFKDGSIIGPYSNINDFRLLNNEKWILIAEKYNSEYRIILENGAEKIIRKFVVVTQKGELGEYENDLGNKAYQLHNKLVATQVNYGMNLMKNEKIYFMVNGDIYGPYDDFVKQIDLGIVPERYNYIAGKERTLYFKGSKGFTSNVKKFTVSDSRNSIAIVKGGEGSEDTLTINDKYIVGNFENIIDIQFMSASEDFVFWCARDNAYELHAYANGRHEYFGLFTFDNLTGSLPTVFLSKSGDHWGLSYTENGGLQKIIVNGKTYTADTIGDIVLYSQSGKDFIAWISKDQKNVYLNKVDL